MLLGNKHYFTKDHYEAKKGFTPPYLSELVVHCLELVSLLSERGIEYRFKGGNSLLILLEDPQRFSIDVDIATPEKKDVLIDTVAHITENSQIFTRYEARAPKTKPWLPLISFKLFFNSFFQKKEDSFVMLDVVLEAPPYPGIRKQVKCLDIYQSTQTVEVPTISGLIGDKFLTLGPATLGIPLGKNKAAQRLKHLFDISLLLKNDYQLDAVSQSISTCSQQENQIQRTSFSHAEIMDDTRDFLETILKYEKLPDYNQFDKTEYIYEISQGFEEFAGYLFKMRYNWQDLRNGSKEILDFMDKI